MSVDCRGSQPCEGEYAVWRNANARLWGNGSAHQKHNDLRISFSFMGVEKRLIDVYPATFTTWQLAYMYILNRFSPEKCIRVVLYSEGAGRCKEDKEEMTYNHHFVASNPISEPSEWERSKHKPCHQDRLHTSNFGWPILTSHVPLQQTNMVKFRWYYVNLVLWWT